jgi:hypothetical protein
MDIASVEGVLICSYAQQFLHEAYAGGLLDKVITMLRR